MEAKLHNRDVAEGGTPSCLRAGGKQAFTEWGILSLPFGIFLAEGSEGSGGKAFRAEGEGVQRHREDQACLGSCRESSEAEVQGT